MKRIFIAILLPVLLAGSLDRAVSQRRGGVAVDVVYPDLGSRTDSLSFYLGMVSGFDIADDLGAIDPRLVGYGLLNGFLTSDIASNDADLFLSEYLSVIHSDEIAESRAEMRRRGESDPAFIQAGSGRYAASTRGDNFLESRYPSDLPNRTYSTRAVEIATVPELSTKLDWALYYRGMKEGYFIAQWLEEIAFKPLVQGVMAGYAIGSADNVDFDDAYAYLNDNILSDADAHSTDAWRRGITLPSGMDVPAMADQRDSLSYFFGIYLGSTMLDETLDVDLELIGRGLSDGYLASNIPTGAIYGYLDYHINVLARDRKKALAIAAVKDQLDELAAQPGYQTTASGLIYQIVEQGDMELRVVDMHDQVDLVYTVTDLAGNVHARSEDNSSPRLADMMEGFFEGVTLVGPGGSIRLYIHPGLTDDADGYERDHGNTIYKAEIEVVDVRGQLREAKDREAVRETLDELAAAPGRRRTPSGLIYEILEPGDPDLRVESLQDRAEMVYRVTFLETGEVHEWSGEDGETPSLGDMLEGFYEGVQLIGAGGQIQLFIPPGLTNDADGYRRSHGASIFKADITLLDVNNKLKRERALVEVKPVMDSLSRLPGIRQTASGLLYEIIDQGDMDYSVGSISDDVKLKYVVTYLDGSGHARSDDKGEIVSLGDMLEGFYEGVQLVGLGGRIKLYIPPGLTDDADGYTRSHGSAIFKADITVLDVHGKMLVYEMERSREIMDSLASLPGISRTESGLLYQIIDPGNSNLRVTKLSDDVEAKYVIYYLDDEIQTWNGTSGGSVSLGDMMEGFYEGVKLIGNGGRIKLYIPPALTNDADGYQRNHGATIFKADITLLDVNNEAQVETNLAGARPVLDSLSRLPDIRKTESGLLYQIIDEGDRNYAVTALSDKAKLRYTVTKLDGESHARSSEEGEIVSLGDMLEGFYEGVKMVGLGGRIKLFIPPGLTNDADGYTRSHGSTVFAADITVLDVNERMLAGEIEKAKVKMDSLASLPGYSRTASGLVYQIVEQGDMDFRVTGMSDDVELKYTIFYLNDDIFSWNGTSGGDVSLGDMMEGFYEGVKLVGQGGRIRLFIPPGLTDDADGYERNHGATIFKADIRVLSAPRRR